MSRIELARNITRLLPKLQTGDTSVTGEFQEILKMYHRDNPPKCQCGCNRVLPEYAIAKSNSEGRRRKFFSQQCANRTHAKAARKPKKLK
jgi:hypothetical protein